jgi:hypothetical protein
MTAKRQPPKPPDVAAMTAKLRAQTIKLLGLDESKLDPGDEILIARAGTLRLTVSDLEAAQMNGDAINVASYVAASEALEAIMRAAHRVSTTDGKSDGLLAARAKLGALLGLIEGETPADADARSWQEMRGRVIRAEDEVDALRKQLAERDERDARPRSETPQDMSHDATQSAPSQPRPPNVVAIRRGETPVIVVSGESADGDFLTNLNAKAW